MARRDRDEEQEEVKPAGITMGKLLMILIPVMLLSIAASGGITYYLGSNMAPGSAEADAEELEALENPDPIYVQVGKILVNVDYQGDIRYIQGDVQLMFHHQESADIATRDMPVIGIIVAPGSAFRTPVNSLFVVESIPPITEREPSLKSITPLLLTSNS